MVGGESAGADEATRVDVDAGTPSSELASAMIGGRESTLADRLKAAVGGALGAALGRYVLLRVLGEGGMGVVFAAYDEELDRKVAIKLLQAPPGGPGFDPSVLRNEARAMARLSHPNIVQIYDVGEVDGQLFMAMEFVVGESLREWYRDRRGRPWRAVIDLLAQAGRGLDAAHQAGLVHCDFKPANVLVGGDGRVRVLDFGLAQLREQRPQWRSESVSDTQQSTRTAGTPAYMAPEIFLEREPDARSDQFAFCVALFEGLFGARPFRGETIPALRRAICAGEIGAPPAESRVPLRIRRAVLRGLDVDPAERWPSMAALLAELERDPSRARRRAGLVVGAAAAIGLSAIGATQWRESATTAALEGCRASEQGIREFVDEGRRAAIRARLLATDVSYAERSVEHAFAALDSFAEGWTEVHARACEGAVRDGTIAPAMMALRERCAARQLDEARAIVEVLEEADATVVERVGGLLASLPDPARCDDLKVLAELGDVLEDPAAAAREEALRTRLYRVHAEIDGGRIQEARVRVDALLDEAEAVDRGLRSEILEAAAHTASDLGEFARAEDLYVRALGDALASDRVAVAAAAANGLAGDATYHRGSLADGERWIRIAEGLVERADDPDLRFGLSLLRAGIASQRRAYAESLEGYQEAVGLASTLRLSPTSRASLRTNLGITLTYVGRFAEASAAHRAAEAILVDAYGEDHPGLGAIITNAGVTHTFAGELEEAIHDYERAAAAHARHIGENNPFFAMTLQNLASAKLEAGDVDGAFASATRARAILAQTVADDEFYVGYVASGLGDIQRRRGDTAAATENCATGLRILSRALGEGHVHLIYPLLCLGELALAEGDAAAARSMLERADGLLGDSVDVSQADRGHVALALARALAATDDPDRARAVAAEAEAAYTAAGPAYRAARAEARALAGPGEGTPAAGQGGA